MLDAWFGARGGVTAGISRSIDWNANSATLTYSLTREVSRTAANGVTTAPTYTTNVFTTNFDTSLPNLTISRNLLKKTTVAPVAPAAFRNWNGANWGYTRMDSNQIYGPVAYVRYRGQFNGVNMDFEVMPIMRAGQTTMSSTNKEWIIEIAFKRDTLAEANTLRNQLQTHLNTKHPGLIIPNGSLKTNTVLTRY